mgnify:CR=1 FL=1
MQEKYLLSLDGGGVREIATITFLSKLEKELDCPLYEKFDYFIGTSAGGITAMALAVQNLNSRSEERRVGKECRSRWSPYH